MSLPDYTNSSSFTSGGGSPDETTKERLPSAKPRLNQSLSEDGEIPSSEINVLESTGGRKELIIDPPHNCIYVGKIPLDFEEDDLVKYFEDFGEIEYLSLAPFRRKSAGSRCFAHLSFRHKDSVVKCLSKDRHVVLGIRLDVESAKSVPKNLDRKRSSTSKSARRRLGRNSRQSRFGHESPPIRNSAAAAASSLRASPSLIGLTAAPVASRKVFIGGLRYTTTSVSLRQHFSQWGEVDEAVVMTDRSQGKSRGFGFVTFKSPDSVDRCQNARPHKIDEQRVDTKRAIPREEMEREGYGGMTTSRLFVGELHRDVEEANLVQYFEAFGQVQSVELMRDRVTGRKRGFAYVEFADYDVVDKIVSQGHHEILKRRINVEKALEPGAAPLKKNNSLKRKRIPAPWSNSSSTEDVMPLKLQAESPPTIYKNLLEQQQQAAAAAAAAMAYCNQFVSAAPLSGTTVNPATTTMPLYPMMPPPPCLGNSSSGSTGLLGAAPSRCSSDECEVTPSDRSASGGGNEANWNHLSAAAAGYDEAFDPRFSPEPPPCAFRQAGTIWPPAVVTTLQKQQQQQQLQTPIIGTDYYTRKYYNFSAAAAVAAAASSFFQPPPPASSTPRVVPANGLGPSVIWEYTAYPKPATAVEPPPNMALPTTTTTNDCSSFNDENNNNRRVDPKVPVAAAPPLPPDVSATIRRC